jgi:4-amino-4-deoxy-L-arabinose transferase-like glycosyltransferase
LKDAIAWWAALRPLRGLLIAVAIAGPWLWLVYQREPTFLPLIFSAAKRHLANSAEKHTGPPGFYLALIWGLFFPWCLLLPVTLVIAWRNRREPLIRFALATVIGVWIFQEIMTTKLPFYLLPTFPALALLTADVLVRCLRGEYQDLHRPGFMVAVAIFAIAVLAMGGAPWSLTMSRFQLGSLVPIGATATLSVAAIVYAAVVVWLFQRRHVARAAVAMGVGVMLIFGLMFGLYLPNAKYLQTSQRLADILRQHDIAGGDAIMIQYKEPSLPFYQGGVVRQESADHYLDRTPPDKWPTWIVMPRGLWESSRPETRALLEPVGEAVRGIDYAGKIDGKRLVDVMVLRKVGK